MTRNWTQIIANIYNWTVYTFAIIFLNKFDKQTLVLFVSILQVVIPDENNLHWISSILLYYRLHLPGIEICTFSPFLIVKWHCLKICYIEKIETPGCILMISRIYWLVYMTRNPETRLLFFLWLLAMRSTKYLVVILVWFSLHYLIFNLPRL